MSSLLVFYGSYRADRLGILLADYLVAELGARGHDVALIDAQAVGLPMLDRMYKEHPHGKAPPAMEALPAGSAARMGSCSSPASTIGASSPA